MSENTGIWLAIPVFNHSTKLPDLISRCILECPNIVVVDDGSTDQDLKKLLSEKPVHLICHKQNLGKAEAIKSAARYIYENHGAFMLTMDADGQHFPEEIAKFTELIRNGGGNIVIGARDFSSKKIPASSRLGRQISNFLIWLETGTTLMDTQSGFRAYPVNIFNEIKCDSSRFSLETEIIVRALWKGYNVSEIDISVSYPEGKGRISHFSFFKDNLRILLLHIGLLLERCLAKRRKSDIRITGGK